MTSIVKSIGKIAFAAPLALGSALGLGGGKGEEEEGEGVSPAQTAAQAEQRRIESQTRAELLSEAQPSRRGRAAGRLGRQLLSFNPLSEGGGKPRIKSGNTRDETGGTGDAARNRANGRRGGRGRGRDLLGARTQLA